MHLSEYQIMAMRTKGKYDNVHDQSKCALIGITGELGEYADLRKKMLYHNKTIDYDSLVKELGDVLWYIALECDSLGINLDTVAGRNIEKLMKRYPDGFSFAAANAKRVD